MVTFCLLVSACGGGGGSGSAVATVTTGATPTTATTQEQDMLAFSTCMRTHGVASFPDPTRNANGSYGFSADLGRVRKLVRNAQNAFGTCEPLLAKSGILSAQNIGKFQQQMLAYARCMRSHDVPGFPDPNAGGRFGGRLKSLDRNTPAFQAAATACRPILSKAIAAFSIDGTSG